VLFASWAIRALLRVNLLSPYVRKKYDGPSAKTQGMTQSIVTAPSSKSSKDDDEGPWLEHWVRMAVRGIEAEKGALFWCPDQILPSTAPVLATTRTTSLYERRPGVHC
jgi:hypothetical protein